MQITEIRMNKLTEGKVKAVSKITLDDCLVLTNVRLVEGKNGLFMAMPSIKGKSDKFYDIVFPITKEFRTELETILIKTYNEKN